MVRKNHIAADITEPIKIIITHAINSHGNTNVKLKRLIYLVEHKTPGHGFESEASREKPNLFTVAKNNVISTSYTVLW